MTDRPQDYHEWLTAIKSMLLQKAHYDVSVVLAGLSKDKAFALARAVEKIFPKEFDASDIYCYGWDTDQFYSYESGKKVPFPSLSDL